MRTWLNHKHLHIVFLIVVGAGSALAQTTTNLTLDLKVNSGGYDTSNSFTYAQTGSVDPLGKATLTLTTLQPVANNAPGAPVQVTGGIYFNEIDSISFSFIQNDAGFLHPQTFVLSGGTITGGTGRYAGATGSLSATFARDGSFEQGWTRTTGSGSVTVAGATTQFRLDLAGKGGTFAQWARDIEYGTASGTASPWGKATATYRQYSNSSRSANVHGTLTVSVNSADSFNIFYYYLTDSKGNPPATFKGLVAGGTGAFAEAGGTPGTITLSLDGSSLHVTGTLTMGPPGAPLITNVRTAFGLPQVAFNTWVEIHGTNLVPPNTPAAGVDWSNAPDFANGQMPTQLGPVSVTIFNIPAYVYWYCSAATNVNCADDQINVLAPLLPTAWEGLAPVVVTTNGVSSAPFLVFRPARSPAFLVFDPTGHVVAEHPDYSLLGPTNLFPGLSTPARPGETVILYGIGFGAVSTLISAGSSSQSGSITPLPDCWVSGVQATVTSAALISPGLYQVNLVVPRSTATGDNPVACQVLGVLTAPGPLIAVQ